MRLPLFYYKYTRFEYWPWKLFYTPLLPYWLYLSVKNKSLAYFTLANPGIELGGFFGESKQEILSKIDSEFLPKHLFARQNSEINTILEQIRAKGIEFPFIAKPDVGERGTMVTKINSEKEFQLFYKKSNTDLIIQEFVDFEIELGILYSRIPNEKCGKVTSITQKEFLSVTGDGISTVRELMKKNVRAQFQLKRFEVEFPELLDQIPKNQTKKIIEPIGNHCRGTRFIDRNEMITKELNELFDKISLPIKDFYFGRFDLKVSGFEDLVAAKNIRILELNGVSSEPGHVYDAQKNNLLKAYKGILSHWKRISQIAIVNKNMGHQAVPFSKILSTYKKYM